MIDDDYVDYDAPRPRRPKERPGAQDISGRPERPAGAGRTDVSDRPERPVRPGKNDRPSGGQPQNSGHAKHTEQDAVANKRKKRHPLRTFILTVFIGLVLVMAAGFVFSYSLVKKAYGLMVFEEAGELDKEALSADGVTNILLIGNDSRLGGEDGRSDAMILVSVSKNTDRILMTSLLRDMYVEIPGYGSNRLNAAYAFGGPELLMETVEQNFGIPVNRYVLVNFEAFANVVDAVGGVDIELTYEEILWVNAYLNEYNELTGKDFGYDYLMQTEGGVVHLNGPQALAYSRNRYIGNDFGRTERQRKVMQQIAGKLPRTLFTDFDGLINALCPNLTTNMKLSECYFLVLRAPFMLRYDTVSGSLPVEGSWSNANIDSMAVLKVNFDTNRRYLEDNLFSEAAE